VAAANIARARVSSEEQAVGPEYFTSSPRLPHAQAARAEIVPRIARRVQNREIIRHCGVKRQSISFCRTMTNW
jgi:hypothetical protein